MNRGTRLGISSRQSERSTGRSQLDPTELKRDYNFLSGKLHGDITFSRGSNATLVGSDGLIKYAPHNLLPRSNEFTHSDWNNPTKMTANRAISPTGENNASEITTESAIYDSVGNVGGNITISIHAKKNTATHFVLSGGYPTANRVIFDLETGVACQVVGVAKHTSESLGNGWFRFSVSVPSSSTDYIQFSGRSSCAYASNNRVVGVYVYGAQIERTFDLNSGPQAYIETTGSAVHGARFDYDKDGNSKGLLIEEARTNLFTNSDFTSGWAWYNNLNPAPILNAGTDPSGGNNAVKIINDSGNEYKLLRPSTNPTATTDNTYCASVYVKDAGSRYLVFYLSDSASRALQVDLQTGQVASFNGNGGYGVEEVGNDGWYRVWFSHTMTATMGSISIVPSNSSYATSLAGNGTDGLLVWGAQFEQGSFPTSLIGTYGASASRSADVAKVDGLAFSRFHKEGTGGAWLVDSTELAEDRTTQSSPFLVHESGGSRLRVGPKVGGGATNAIAVYYQDGGDMIYSAGALGTVTKGVKSKLGVTFKTNDGAFTRDGKTPNTDTSIANIYSPTELRLGDNGSGTTVFCGHIARLRYFNKRISNNKLKKETDTPFLLNKYPRAKAAHSLRALMDDSANSPVTRIRRSYDSFEADYTANQVSNGELENDFKSEAQTTLPLDVSVEADEMVVNGDFSHASNGWVLDTGFSIGSGTLNRAAASASFAQVSSMGVVVGKTYDINFDIVNHSTGINYLSFGGDYLTKTQNSNGSYSYRITATSTQKLQFYAGTNAVYSIDNISVKEVNPIATGFSTRLINADYKGKPLMRIRNQSNVEAELYADANDQISLSSSIKGSSQNLLAYSENFGEWGVQNSSVQTSGQSDPNGGQNAWLISGGTAAAGGVTLDVAVTNDKYYTLSGYFKKGTSTKTRLSIHYKYIEWDWSTSGVPSLTANSSEPLSITFTPVGTDGWYRISFVWEATATATRTINIDPDRNNTNKTVYAFGMQLEETQYESTPSGSEKVDNGTFDTDTGWTKNSGWTIADGKATKNSGDANYMTDDFTGNGRFEITYTISDYVSGDVKLRVGTGFSSITRTANGTYTETLHKDSATFGFYGSGEFSIDNVSVKETLPVLQTYSQTPVIVSSHHNIATDLQSFAGKENLIPYSEDTSEWNNLGGANVNLTSGLADPFGGTNAFSIQSTTASFLNNLNTKTAAVIEPNSTNTYSFFVKKETSKTNFGGVAINITGGTTKIGYIIIDEVNGTAVNTTDSTINTPTISVTEPITGWYRVAITVEDTHSNTNAFMIFYSGLSSNGTTLSAVTGSPRTIFGAQLNTGSTLKTYQATTGTALTGDCHLSVWYCQNGNSDFVNDTASEQPRIVMGSELVTDSGGKASVYFDGGDTLDNNTLAGNNRLDSYTIQDTSDSTYVIPSSATSGSHYGIYANNDTSSSAGSHAGSASFGTPNIYRNGAVFSTSTLNDVHDGLTGKSNLLTMEGASTSVWTSFTVGHYFNNSAPSFNFTGKISEMVFFPNMDSSPKRFNIEQNMLNHFDIGLMDIDFEGVSATDMSNNTIIGPSGNSTIGSVALSGETSNPISGTNSLKLSITGGNNNTYPRIYTTANGSMPEDAQIGTKYRVTFDTKLVSGSATLAGLGFADGGNKEKGFLNTNSTSDNVVLSGTQSHSFENTITELTGTVSARNDLFWSWRGTEGDSVVLIDNIKIKKIGFTGFVTTLYDQTGNNCHALQSTAAYQPQLVSGGDLIKSGNHPAWEHVTASNMLMEGKIQAAHLDAWFVAEPDSADTHYLYPANYASTGDHGFVAQDTSSTNALLADYGNPTLYANGTSLGTTGASLTRDGIHTSLSGRKLVHHQGADTADWAKLQMGYFGSTSDSTFNFQGKFSEWIWYDSDQSSNKTGIESNINSHYNIYS